MKLASTNLKLSAMVFLDESDMRLICNALRIVNYVNESNITISARTSEANSVIEDLRAMSYIKRAEDVVSRFGELLEKFDFSQKEINKLGPKPILDDLPENYREVTPEY